MIELALAISLHLGLDNDYNEIHPHIRYTENGYIAGAYYNSVEKVSTYAGYRWEWDRIGFEAGAVTGYPQADVMPYARATYDNFFVTPAMERGTVGTVIGYEIKW